MRAGYFLRCPRKRKKEQEEEKHANEKNISTRKTRNEGEREPKRLMIDTIQQPAT